MKKEKALVIVLGSIIFVTVLILAGIFMWEKGWVRIFSHDPVLAGRTYIKEASEEDIVHDKENGADYVKNQLIVSAQLHTTKREMDKVVKPLGAEVVGVISSISTFQIEFKNDMTYDELKEMAEYLKSLDIVRYATFNYAAEIVPN